MRGSILLEPKFAASYYCLVAGNAFFKAENKAEVVKKLKGIQ